MRLALGAFLFLLILSLVVPVFLFFLLRDGLRELLQRTVKLPGAVTFYLRSFLVVLFLSALSAAIGTSFELKADSQLRE